MADSNFLSSVLNYGKSFAQGASNSIAGNVSAPVDGLAWLLRRAGVPMPSNPVGGSDWMNQQGLTQQPQHPIAGMLGEAAGMAGPMVAAAKAPQIAKGLLQMGENAMVPRTMNPQTGAVVWHGSPHKFDAFDSSKIGTGEGAQAYGHGLYLADSPDVAKRYMPGIARPHVDGVDAASLGQPVWEVADTMASRGFGVDDYMNFQKKYRGSQIESAVTAGNSRKAELLKESLDEELKIAETLRTKRIEKDKGSFYKVDLPDEHIAKMLDWDAPLSQQTQVTDMLDKAGLLDNVLKAGGFSRNDIASGIFEGRHVLPASRNGGGADTSNMLRQAGIPGIRYLDGGSRATGGTSNYVVFPGNEHLLNIQERNGVPLKSLLNK